MANTRRLVLLAFAGCFAACGADNPGPSATSTDYAAVGDLAVAAPVHEDWAAGLRLGTGLVHDHDRTKVEFACLMRVPPGPASGSVHTCDCRNDGNQAHIVQKTTCGTRTVDVALAVARKAGAAATTELRLDGKVVDLTKGRLFLVDLRTDTPMSQIEVDMPAVALSPLGDGGAMARGKTHAKELLAQLIANPKVSAFVAGK